jgi:drug/metabolite transporter (DMT)-like permease
VVVSKEGLTGHASLAAIGSLLASLGCVVALHLLRADLDPTAHRLSEYATGPYGWLMTAAFMLLGCALLALAVGLGSSGWARGWARWVPAMVALAGVGMIMSGIFETDSEVPPRPAEIVHSRASGTAFLALILAALLWSAAQTFARRPLRHTRVSAGLAVVVVVAGSASPLLHHSRWTGVGQRVLCLALGAWLLLTAWQLGVRTGPVP